MTKWLALSCGLVFWSIGFLSVVSWHSQQDHKKINVEYSYLKSIETKLCRYCFVDLKD